MKIYNLDSRFEDFAASIVVSFMQTPKSFAADYLSKQLIRSACSSALNFGEFEGAGSDKDRANKLRIALKELRESLRNINIQIKANLIDSNNIAAIRNENDELIRIVVSLLKKYS
ncbi:four helix bundle protein [Ulvibacter sp. MAR_2010_11]|uniref:four helix bundle protein n=1 Tax=Ulvibacter sp. MAR_2010_11 TaxID=1250229 RepID=UPI000C2C394D|nr:four helix bundle protein [Ulvibacter sp. MAR_2010_11]PKA83360.1 four helix bundle protein [Ulvibacter sp. MAR_2010_11]